MTGRRFTWHLNDLMHRTGIHQASTLQRQLADHGVELSSSQVHRLVTGVPSRLNLDVLAALCEILSCSPNDLVEVHTSRRRRAAASSKVVDLATTIRPKRARVLRERNKR